jgi:hypothetical protein
MKRSSVTRIGVTKGRLCRNGTEYFCNVMATLVKLTSKQTHFGGELFSYCVCMYFMLYNLFYKFSELYSNYYLLLLT